MVSGWVISVMLDCVCPIHVENNSLQTSPQLATKRTKDYKYKILINDYQNLHQKNVNLCWNVFISTGKPPSSHFKDNAERKQWCEKNCKPQKGNKISNIFNNYPNLAVSDLQLS